MKFCSNCKKIRRIDGNENKEGVCSCDPAHTPDGDVKVFEKVVHSEEPSREVLDVEKIKVGGKFPHKCSKCGHKEAQVVDMGASYGDEASIYLFKCNECGHVDRQADGASNA